MEKKKIIIFLMILVVLILLVTWTGYLLFNKKEAQGDQLSKSIRPTENTWEVDIVDGDIYKITSSNDNELLVSTTDIKDKVINQFVLVSVSPDKTKMCFVGQSVVPQWLYYSNSDGSEITQVGVGKNCVWSNDSQKIAFNNHTTDVSPVNVLVYNLSTKNTTNYTAKVQSNDLIRAYEIPVWSKDDNYINSKYSSLSMDGTGKTDKGTSVINIITGKIKDE